MIIKIKNEKIVIDDLLIDPSFTIKQFRDAFGEPDRITKLKNEIHTFDEKGLYVYLKDEDKVSQISLDFSKGVSEFSPKKIFQGDVIVGDVKVNNFNDIENIDAMDVIDDEFESEGIITLELKNVGVSFEIDPNTKKINSIDFWYKN